MLLCRYVASVNQALDVQAREFWKRQRSAYFDIDFAFFFL